MVQHGVTAALRVIVPKLDHQVASVFLAFMRSTGAVNVDGQTITDRLFESDFYATGLPITEAYWTTVTLKGVPTDVLVQCFERRCLTYTPTNPDGWQVEAGNVGRHYHAWRTARTGGEPIPTATNTPPAGSTPTNTPPAGSTPTNTPTSTATATTAPTNTPTSTPTPTPTATQDTGGSDTACLSATERELLALINDHRANNGLAPFSVSGKLNTAAHKHSLDMATRDYFDHDTPLPLPAGQSGPEYSDRIHDAGYTGYTRTGENIAAGYPTAQAAFNGWKGSPGHNNALLSSTFTQIGLGHAFDPDSTYGHYWTADFGNGNDSGGC